MFSIIVLSKLLEISDVEIWVVLVRFTVVSGEPKTPTTRKIGNNM